MAGFCLALLLFGVLQSASIRSRVSCSKVITPLTLPSTSCGTRFLISRRLIALLNWRNPTSSRHR